MLMSVLLFCFLVLFGSMPCALQAVPLLQAPDHAACDLRSVPCLRL
jgi:hypothetical protein